MKNIKGKIGLTLLLLIILLGATLVASYFYFRSQMREGIADALSTSQLLSAINPEGSTLQIVAFIDYADDVTYKIYQTMKQAVEADGHVRVVLRPIPREGDSYYMALFMDAAFRLDTAKAKMLHDKMLARDYPPTFKYMKEVASELGMSVAKIEQEAKTEATRQNITDNVLLFRKIGFQTAPSFVIGHKGYKPNRENIAGINAWMLMMDDARTHGILSASSKP